MRAALDTVLSVDSRDDVDEIESWQLRAANERFAQLRRRIAVLDHRAREVGVEAITAPGHLVPLLFAHSTYKSYPESFVTERKWQLLGSWMATLSSCDITAVDLSAVADIDDWIDRFAAAGITVLASSGTTGKHSFITLNTRDFELVRSDLTSRWTPAQDVPVGDVRPFAYLGPVDAPPLLKARRTLLPAHADLLANDMVRLSDGLEITRIRTAMADGSARPGDITAVETKVRERGERLTAAMADLAATIFARRSSPQTVVGLLGMFWRLLLAGRDAGIPDNSFHPDTLISMGGGLKGLLLPEDYQEQFERFFGPIRSPKSYGMSELIASMPMCEAGVYHVGANLIPLIVDEAGERLLEAGADGRVTGRFAAFDISLEGHWGGIVTGDRVTADFASRCTCNQPGPVILADIARYSELSPAGDDKLTCGGTMEQYIRGSFAAD